MIKYINQNEFKSEVLKEKEIVLVDFFATWCKPCKRLNAVLEELQGDLKDLKIVKINIDENIELAKEYDAKRIPTIKLFKNGEEVSTSVGFLPKESLIELIKNIK